MKPSAALAIDLKMEQPKARFPWYFFWQNIRLNFIVGGTVFASMWFYEPALALKSAPFMLVGFFVSTFIFYRNTKPLSRLLSRVARIVANDLPYRNRLELLYERNEWAQIEAALTDADQKLHSQLKTIQAENRKFTTLLASISNEILAIDKQQNVLFYNPRFERTFLYSKEKLQSGGKLWSVLDIIEARNVFNDVIIEKQTKKLKGFSLEIYGETRYFNLTVSPLPGDDSDIGGAVGVFSDVTDAKRTEQMRVDFVANVSHEIRTPLTSVKGFTQVLKANKAKLPEDLHGFIDRILHNTERMIALFNDLLQLSVIESRDKIRPEIVEIDELINHVEAGVKALHKEKDIKIEKKISVKEFNVDPKLFEQVLTNLIENACKYGGAHPQITIETYQSNKALCVQITDNGPGIGKEHLARIFERFYRVDHSRDRETGGTGLGLAIVKHIIMKHHGNIHAESDGLHGTKFIIELPL
ncbi:MAG: PAS domain S-box protein [Bacteriovoracaceae bacterium]|nr:PAS domain S-box protein [Bacteriovoracaceae bacterium]